MSNLSLEFSPLKSIPSGNISNSKTSEQSEKQKRVMKALGNRKNELEEKSFSNTITLALVKRESVTSLISEH